MVPIGNYKHTLPAVIILHSWILNRTALDWSTLYTYITVTIPSPASRTSQLHPPHIVTCISHVYYSWDTKIQNHKQHSTITHWSVRAPQHGYRVAIRWFDYSIIRLFEKSISRKWKWKLLSFATLQIISERTLWSPDVELWSLSSSDNHQDQLPNMRILVFAPRCCINDLVTMAGLRWQCDIVVFSGWRLGEGDYAFKSCHLRQQLSATTCEEIDPGPHVLRMSHIIVSSGWWLGKGDYTRQVCLQIVQSEAATQGNNMWWNWSWSGCADNEPRFVSYGRRLGQGDYTV